MVFVGIHGPKWSLWVAMPATANAKAANAWQTCIALPMHRRTCLLPMPSPASKAKHCGTDDAKGSWSCKRTGHPMVVSNSSQVRGLQEAVPLLISPTHGAEDVQYVGMCMESFEWNFGFWEMSAIIHCRASSLASRQNFKRRDSAFGVRHWRGRAAVTCRLMLSSSAFCISSVAKR